MWTSWQQHAIDLFVLIRPWTVYCNIEIWKKKEEKTLPESSPDLVARLEYLGLNSSNPSENTLYKHWEIDQRVKGKDGSLLLFLFHIYSLQRKLNNDAVLVGRANNDLFVQVKSLSNPTTRWINTKAYVTLGETG